jgi:fructose-bisphosphate aldolase class II
MNMIFQIGTNNWQVEGGGFAPGSGILHEAHHNAYNKLPNTKSYSVWPLPPKLTHEPAPGRTDYRVFKLNHDIPICESVSPVSNFRWHSMSESDFAAYRKRLGDFCYDFMEFAEKEAGHPFTTIIAHHAFLNGLVGKDILERRKAAGKPDCHLCVFVHGTALKMYVHELGGANPQEYPMRFFPIIDSERLFAKDSGIVSRIFTISRQQVDAFKEVFKEFPDDKVTVSPNGIDFDTFHAPSPPMSRDQVLAELKHVPYDGAPQDIPGGFDEMITFVGKFANWKRLDSVLYAAAIYEKQYASKGKKVCTIIVGSGPPEAIKLYQDLALKELGLKYCYFLGAQTQPTLAKLYAVSSVGVFPSKAEPFGLVFVECMACECPVIGANSGGPIDFVNNAVGTLVPEPGSYSASDVQILSKDLAKTIAQCIDENWKASKGAACLKLARDRFGVENQVTKLIQSVGAGKGADPGAAFKNMKSFWEIPGMKAGVVTGDVAWNLLQYCKAKGFALPAFNCTGSSTVNSVLEAAAKIGMPAYIQFSEGGSAFFAGKDLPNKKKEASILGAVAGAHFTRLVAPAYGIPVLVHSDHCAKKLLPWFDGMLEADMCHFQQFGEPLFSSHMLDLSEEPHDENVSICASYLKKMAPMKLILEMEIGITGGVEDGVDNSSVSKDKLYSTPEDTELVWNTLSPISPMFTIAAAFGNVHGVYKPGNVKLQPELLKSFQTNLGAKLGYDKPFHFVFHGGSGSEKQDIHNAVDFGVVKMNVDTDTQWAYWEGLLKFYQAKSGYLQGQIGNPDGEDKPNKSYYDPRKWVRVSEESMRDRVIEGFRDLKGI